MSNFLPVVFIFALFINILSYAWVSKKQRKMMLIIDLIILIILIITLLYFKRPGASDYGAFIWILFYLAPSVIIDCLIKCVFVYKNKK